MGRDATGCFSSSLLSSALPSSVFGGLFSLLFREECSCGCGIQKRSSTLSTTEIVCCTKILNGIWEKDECECKAKKRKAEQSKGQLVELSGEWTAAQGATWVGLHMCACALN